MGILDRLQLLARASRTAAQGSDGADIREQLAAGQQSIADLSHELERLREGMTQAKKDGAFYEERAAEALRRNDEDAARAELRRKVEAERHRDRLVERRDALLTELTQLEDVMTELAGTVDRRPPTRSARPSATPRQRGGGYYQPYRRDGDGSTAPERRIDTWSATDTPRTRPTTGRGDVPRPGAPSTLGWERAVAPSASADPFERFDSFSDRVESKLAGAEAERALSEERPGETSYTSAGDHLSNSVVSPYVPSPGSSDPALEREFDRLEADRNLRDLKDRAAKEPKRSDPLSRLKDRLSDED